MSQNNQKKQRTHIPVEGYTIEDLQKKSIEELTNIAKELGIEKKNFAVEVNRKIVRRKDFDNFSLKDGDKVEIIHFVGGG